jgi:hypothetical protein
MTALPGPSSASSRCVDDQPRSSTAEAIAVVIRAHRFHHATESELQEGIAAALVVAGYRVEREVRLSARDRIDLLVDRMIGVEVKIAGEPRAVARQLARYAASDQIRGLVLVTNRVRHRPLPLMHGKPVVVASLLGAGL